MNKKLWLFWGLLTIGLMSYLGYKMFYHDDKSEFLIGEASHGHYQIELACETCHTDSFGGIETLQTACESCHAAELEEAHDSHPKKKFTNPRNADLAEYIDAKYCVSCHTEHQNEQTGEMGLTLPDDYCFHCHETVGEDRSSHAGLAFDSCASAGCHNFHDNRALYEKFLVDNANQPWLNQISQVYQRTNAATNAPKGSSADEVASDKIQQHPEIHKQWLMSKHMDAQVSCNSCHLDEEKEWLEKPGLAQCQTCHKDEVSSFTEGRHGMRLSDKLTTELSPMSPELGRLSFHEDAQHQTLTCATCHNPHTTDTKPAAEESCLSCHSDEHTLAYEASSHAELWQKELAGELPEGSGVSCATCHMPRVQEAGFGDKPVMVQHNQNWNLRPNEKMIRPVCMQCHSLEFSIDALADEALIKNNFNGKPNGHIESIDWSLRRVK